MNLFYMLDVSTINNVEELCTQSAPLLKIVGVVVLIIKIIAPLTLIIVGMIDMTKAIAGKDENTIKDAQKKLIKKAIAAVVVFLVITMVTIIMSLIGGSSDKKCMDCVNSPFGTNCNNLIGTEPAAE